MRILFHGSYSEHAPWLLGMVMYVSLSGMLLTLFTPRFGDQQIQYPVKLARNLGQRRKLLALLIVVSGLLTFFLPLITTEPSVLGRTAWSPWDILWGVYKGDLLPNRSDVFSLPLMAPLIYVLLLIALAALLQSRSPDVLARIAAIGCCCIWLWRGDRISFEEMFYGHFSYQHFSLIRRVGFGTLTITLLGVMGLLLLLAMDKNLDEAAKSVMRMAIADVKEPEFLDAEVLPPDPGVKQSGPRRLGD